MTNHLPLVEGYFAENLDDVLHLRNVPLEQWDRHVDRLHAPFGFLPGDLVLLCPELIAQQVAHLADEELVVSYLMYVEHHICLHAIHYTLAGDELERLVDRATYDCAPESARLGNEIQARALDRTHA